MKTDMKKACLFGGALMAAGVSHAAPELTLPGNIPPYADNFLTAYVYDYYTAPYASGGTQTNTGIGSSYSTSFAGGTAYASLTTTELHADSSNAGLDYFDHSTATSYAYASVTEDAILRLTWDFTGEGAGGPLGRAEVVDWSAGGVLVFGAAAFSAGTMDVALTAGTNYGIIVRATSGPGASAFATAEVIPAPASVALMGLAGIAATRRRR